MCEGGLGATDAFQRAVAHWVYIDQAIRARDGREAQAAFVAYDAGESPIAPGDLLCTARRPGYRTIADRRRQMGEGARTHCDVVVKVDEGSDRLAVIGGNVHRSVTMKLLPAVRGTGPHLRPRAAFVHMKLRADPIEADALDHSATIKALGCGAGLRPPRHLAMMNVAALPPGRC
jgi:hypothetical protein